MPLYTWKCDKCEERIEILRSISKSDDKPDPDEDKELPAGCEHSWKRHIGEAPQKSYGSNWGYGRKGSW